MGVDVGVGLGVSVSVGVGVDVSVSVGVSVSMSVSVREGACDFKQARAMVYVRGWASLTTAPPQHHTTTHHHTPPHTPLGIGTITNTPLCSAPCLGPTTLGTCELRS